RLICRDLRLETSTDPFDFILSNAQTGEEYRDDRYTIHRNTSLLVRKIAASAARWEIVKQPPANVGDTVGSTAGRDGESARAAEEDDRGMLAVLTATQGSLQRRAPPWSSGPNS